MNSPVRGNRTGIGVQVPPLTPRVPAPRGPPRPRPRALRGRDPVAVTAVQFMAAALATAPYTAITEGMPGGAGRARHVLRARHALRP